MEIDVQSSRPHTNKFCDFSAPICLKYSAATKKWGQLIRLNAPVMQNHLSNLKIWCSKMQPLSRNQARGPSNISDSCVSCTAPATQADPLHISYACQCFWHCYIKPSRFDNIWLGAQSLGPATPNDIWTSKSGPNMCCFWHFISHLPTWLRTRRFSEPTFHPPEQQNIGKGTVFRDFSTFSCTCIFFLLTLSLLWSSFFFSSLLFVFSSSDSSHLCFFMCPIILSEVWLLNFLRYIYI